MERASRMTQEEIIQDERQRQAAQANWREMWNRRASRLNACDWKQTIDAFVAVTPTQRAAEREIRVAIGAWPQERRSYYIWGPDYGPGKSHLARAYAIGVLDKGGTVVVWRVRVFRNALMASWRDYDMTGPGQESKERDLVVFDDLEKSGLDLSSPTQHGELYDLVDWMSDQGKAIVVTSNLPLRSLGRNPSALCLESLFGGAFVDRLARCRELYISGPSGRRLDDGQGLG